MKCLLPFLVVLTLMASPAGAVLPNEQLANPQLEARARAISAGLRCVVCQNQSIDDSNAELAHDLRVLLRERLTAGDTDEQAVAFLVKRYGDYVLLKPPFTARTVLLWLGPLLVLLIGISGVTVYLRRRQTVPNTQALTAEEQMQLDRLLKDEAL